MKLFITLSALLAVVVALDYRQHHQHEDRKHIPIVHSESFHGNDGSFKHGYESANGITVQEEGFIRNAGAKDGGANVVHGSYSYVDPNGVPVSVSYTADENGFQAQGAHIPTPPPLPKALVEAYAKAARHPESHADVHYSKPKYVHSRY